MGSAEIGWREPWPRRRRRKVAHSESGLRRNRVIGKAGEGARLPQRRTFAGQLTGLS